jgi:hypothetical protein
MPIKNKLQPAIKDPDTQISYKSYKKKMFIPLIGKQLYEEAHAFNEMLIIHTEEQRLEELDNAFWQEMDDEAAEADELYLSAAQEKHLDLSSAESLEVDRKMEAEAYERRKQDFLRKVDALYYGFKNAPDLYKFMKQILEASPNYQDVMQDVSKSNSERERQYQLDLDKELESESQARLDEYYNEQEQLELQERLKQWELEQENELNMQLQCDLERVPSLSHKRFNDRKAPSRPKDFCFFGRKDTQKKEGERGQFGSRQNMRNSLVDSERRPEYITKINRGALLFH